MDVCTEAFYYSVSVVVLVTVHDEVNSVNRKSATAIGAIESYKPMFTAAVTVFQVETMLTRRAVASFFLLKTQSC